MPTTTTVERYGFRAVITREDDGRCRWDVIDTLSDLSGRYGVLADGRAITRTAATRAAEAAMARLDSAS